MLDLETKASSQGERLTSNKKCGSENWSHQLEMSRNAWRMLRSERAFWEREAARCSSLAIPDPPSRKLITVSSCSMPSIRGSAAAPTRDGSSPSSFAKVYRRPKGKIWPSGVSKENLRATRYACR